MFLQVMDKEEKEKFLELVYKVANADGEYAEEEKEIVNSYMKELSIDTIKDTLDIESLLLYFSTKAETLKRIVAFEIFGLIQSDEIIDGSEEQVLASMAKAFNFEDETINAIKESANKLKETYDQIYNVLFD